MSTKYMTIFSVLLFFLLLFLFPLSALSGAKNGLLLWFQTVLPALLPFAIISNVIIRLDITSYLTALFYPIFKKLFHISKYGCYPIIIGLLCGYPMGAKTCADLVKSNKIQQNEGQFILSFCNNASPIFITSYITITCLEITNHPYLFLFIIYGSALLVAFLSVLANKTNFQQADFTPFTNTPKKLNTRTPSFFRILDDSILDSFELLTKIGGYIILFSLAAQIIYDLAFLPMSIKILLSCILEITTGANMVTNTVLPLEIKIVLITALTSFGGLSSFAQTKSVITGSGLSIKKYLISKLITGLLTALITILWLWIS